MRNRSCLLGAPLLPLASVYVMSCQMTPPIEMVEVGPSFGAADGLVPSQVSARTSAATTPAADPTSAQRCRVREEPSCPGGCSASMVSTDRVQAVGSTSTTSVFAARQRSPDARNRSCIACSVIGFSQKQAQATPRVVERGLHRAGSAAHDRRRLLDR